MSIRAVAYIKGLTICPNGEHISRSEKMVGLILGDSHQDRAHRRTYPSVDGMAQDAMVSERQFLRLLASLERKGVIRREYPDGHGRGKTTFYFFPQLDDRPAVKQPVDASPEPKEGCKNVTLSSVNEPLEKVTFSGQKGDRRVTSDAPLYINKNNKSNKDKDTPLPPASGGIGGFNSALAVNEPAKGVALERAVDQVMFGCGFVRRRLRRVLRMAIERRCDVGEEAPTVALAMIEAWKNYLLCDSDGLLRCRSGPEKFFGDGEWCSAGGLRFDHKALEMHRNARVGSR